MKSSSVNVPPEWALLISGYLAYQRAAGLPHTTIDTRRQHVAYLARRIGCAPAEVTPEQLRDWCAEQPWARESRRGRQNTYRYFWRWCETEGIMPDATGKLPRVKASAPAPRPAPDRVYLKALMKSDVRARLILRLAAEIGLRRGEIALVHSDDMLDDLVGWSLIVHGKGGKQRIVPLTPGIAQELLDLPDGWAFPGRDGGHLSARWVGKIATRLLDGQWTLHTLRHRFATRTYQIDKDVFAVQELLGHASAETTRRYVLTDRSRLRGLVEAAAG